MSGFLDRIFPSKDAAPAPQPTQTPIPPVESRPAARSPQSPQPQPGAGEPTQAPVAQTAAQQESSQGGGLFAKIFPPKDAPAVAPTSGLADTPPIRPATVTPPATPPSAAAPAQQQAPPTAVEPSSPPTAPPPAVRPFSAPPVQPQAQPAAAAPIQQAVPPLPAKPRGRAKQLTNQREAALRDLGGLLYEMYHRDRFRKDLLDFKCAEIGRIDGEIRALTYGPPAAPADVPQPPSNESPAA